VGAESGGHRREVEAQSGSPAIAEDGLIVAGSAGQRRLNAAATELRQGRVAVGKLLGEIALPSDDGRVATARQKRARHAAETRWGVRRGAA
jgi:hypothetical protein